MDSEIRIQVASDPEHEKVFAEIYVGDRFVAHVSQENGLDRLEIEFPGPDLVEERVCRQIDLGVFLKAVDLAARQLTGEP